MRVRVADLRPAIGVHWTELDQDRVERFRKILDGLPPVVVFKTQRGLYVVDGFHRTAAAHLEGRETIDAEVRKGSHAEALRYATRTAQDADRTRVRETVEEHLVERYGPKAWAVQYMEWQFRPLRARLEPGEVTLAESRAYGGHGEKVEARHLVHAINGPGHAIVVTDRRVLWMGRRDERWMRDLPFSSVTAYTEVFHGHRYAIALEHTPIERLHWVPAHRFFNWSWGNAEAIRSATRSFMAFSHRNTAAAKAIRAQLQARDVPARENVILLKDPRARMKGKFTATLIARVAIDERKDPSGES